MGIDVRDSLMVGAYYEELEDFIHAKIEESEDAWSAEDVVEEYFEYASPYYDAPIEDWFIGFEVPNSMVDDELIEKVLEGSGQFQSLTGVKPRIRGGAHVY